MTTCKICKKEFEKRTGSPWNRKLCSDACTRQNGIDNARAQAEKKRKQPVIRKCRQCKKDVVSSVYCPRSFCDGVSGKCYKEFLSESRKGEENPAYRNGFAMAGSRKYTGLHLRACAKYRKAYLETHDYLSCEVCGVNGNATPRFEVHHIYYASLWPKHKHLHDFKNLILVCIACHNNFHASKLKEKFAELEKERGLKELFN